MKRQLILLSGGLDSMVAAFKSYNLGYELAFLTFNYGQITYNKEKECAEMIAQALGVAEHFFLDITFIREFGPIAMIDGDIFLEYKNRELAYIPFRNGIFLSFAAAYAEMHNIQEILLCTHKTDTICPDVSPTFMRAVEKAINIGTKTETPIAVKSPFAEMTKKEIVGIGVMLDVPFEMSWSCYNSLTSACGQCSNCLDRIEAFQSAGVPDKIPYVSGAFKANNK